MYTLGINAAYHDSAACLVRDGVVLAAAEEERFTHIKHGKRPVPFSTWELPFHAIDYCLREAGITPGRRGPRRLLLRSRTCCWAGTATTRRSRCRWSRARTRRRPSGRRPGTRCSSSSIVNAPRQLADGAPHHLQARFRGARADGPYRWHFVAHHLAHAASAFHASPFERAAVMTLDGRGEKATTGYAIGQGTRPGMARPGPHAALARPALRAGDRATSASCTRPTSTR